MKTIIYKMGLITLLAFLTLGCAPKVFIPPQDELSKEEVIAQRKPPISVKRTNPMLGTLIGCSERDEYNGFTKEGCGIYWGVPLNISWE